MLRTDRASRTIHARPAAIFDAFSKDAIMAWLPPEHMTGRLLEYDLRVGGRYRIELTYDEGSAGKTTDRTDVTAGRFLAIDENERIVQTVEFESPDPSFAGEMLMTWTFDPLPDGARVTVTAENVPSGITRADHDEGLKSSLANLARYVESRDA